MRDRPKLFDDLAGMAGGAVSAISGLRDEAEKAIPGPLFAPKSAPLGRSEP